MDRAEGLIPPGVERPVAVFAHPDDESLWAGGLLSTSGHRWTVICCTMPSKFPHRAVKYFDACRMLGVEGRILPQFEAGSDDEIDFGFLDLDQYDFVLTHGAAGEYGHRHHRLIHAHIKAAWRGPAAFVGYGGESRIRYPLTEAEQKRKLAAIRCYNSAARNGHPQWHWLLKNYGKRFDLANELYG